jgi:hypothetical protein
MNQRIESNSIVTHNILGLKPWEYSVSVDVSAKGFVQPSIHVYSDDMKQAIQQAVSALNCLVSDLRDNGFRVATDIREKEKEKVET